MKFWKCKKNFFTKLEKKIDNWNYEREAFFKLLIVIITILIYNIYNTISEIPLEQKEKIKVLKNIEFFLEKENNKNKDLILEELKNKDLDFLKKYQDKKILGLDI